MITTLQSSHFLGAQVAVSISEIKLIEDCCVYTRQLCLYKALVKQTDSQAIASTLAAS